MHKRRHLKLAVDRFKCASAYTVLKVVSKRWGAELAMDDRVAGGHEGGRVWGGVSPLQWCPPPQ